MDQIEDHDQSISFNIRRMQIYSRNERITSFIRSFIGSFVLNLCDHASHHALDITLLMILRVA
jgi:hypothetical protein